MHFFRRIRNSHGFTLTEIIASIAILSMVVAILLPIFPQIISWTNSADEKLVASNLLGQIVHDVQDETKNQPLLESLANSSTCELGMTNVPELWELSIYELNGETYKIELEACKEEAVNLYRTHIRVYFNQHELSETYTYIAAGDVNE